MSQRGTTNALLAIIAGVLLFGQSAMVGAIKWAAIAAIALIVIVIVFRLAAWIISSGIGAVREVIYEWRSDAPFAQKAASAGGLLILPFGIWFALTWTWMWMTGTSNTKDAVFDTWAGKAWIVVLVAVLGAGAVLAVAQFLIKTYGERSKLPGRVKKALLYWVIGLFAVVAFPVNEFRHRRLEGSGIVGTVIGPACMLVAGAAVSLSTVGFSMLAVAAVLLALGVVK